MPDAMDKSSASPVYDTKYLQPKFLREIGGSGVLLLRNKRQKRLTRWRQLAEIASNLPPNTEPKAVASAQKLLQWIDKNKLALEQGMDAPGEELPGGGVKEVGIWGEFQQRINSFANEALGMRSGNVFSAIGMTAFERELIGRLTNAGVNVAKHSPEQLLRVEKKLRKTDIGDPGSTLPQLNSSAYLIHRTQSAAAASPSKHIASPQYTQAFRDSNDASSTRTRLSKAISSKSHSDRMQGKREDMGVTKEIVREWLKNPDGIDNEKRFAITQFQNRQWKLLYDAKNDPARAKDQARERLEMETLKTLKKLPMTQMTNFSRPSRHSSKGKTADNNDAMNKETQEEFLKRSEQDRQEKIRKKMLCKRLRNNLQKRFTKTQTLPMDLFRAFKKYDEDKSGAIDFEEFKNVCESVGMGASILSHEDMRTLFEQSDSDGGGTVDFSEFLRVVVGNLVSL